MECHRIGGIDLRQLDGEDLREIRRAVPKYGVVCVEDQTLCPEEMIALTRRLGEPVLLPEALRFNNTYKEYPELARVSNILPDGTLLREHAAAEYWHSDGDFWQPGQNYLFNLLYSKVVPEVGGQTGFVDLRDAYDALEPSTKALIEGLRVVVSCEGIPDFKDAKPEEMVPDAYHAIKHVHVDTGRVGLYFGHAFAQVDGLSPEDSLAIVNVLMAAVEEPAHQYIHDWSPGDLLLWDNTSVMHRSMGGYANSPRLLYRTQAFMTPCFRDGGALRESKTSESPHPTRPVPALL